MDEIKESKCVFDRLPPEMNRFILRKLSTEDLLVASTAMESLYRVAQHHMYLSESALLVRGGQDTAATVSGVFDVRKVASLYLVDVLDFERDVPRQFFRENGNAVDSGNDSDDDDDDDNCGCDGDDLKENGRGRASLDVLHVDYARDVRYADLPADGLHRLLSGVRAKRVYFNNVLVTVDDVADVVSALLESRGGDDDGDDDDDGGRNYRHEPPPVLGFSYDRADDAEVLALLDMVERTCAGLLAEFRVTVRRPAPHAYAIYPMSCSAAYEDYDADSDGDSDIDGDAQTGGASEAVVAVELPDDLLALTASDCSGLRPSAYKRLASTGHRVRRLCMKAARQADDVAFAAVAAMPSLQHLDMDGMSNVTSDGLLHGLEKASGLQSLGLSECPYLTDDVLHRVGQLRRLRRLRLDLTACDKATAAGVLDMLSGSERLHELYLTMPLSAAHVDAAARAASLRRLQLFWLTFERLSFEDHLDNQPADDGWHRTLAARFRGDVDFRVGQTFTRIVVTAD